MNQPSYTTRRRGPARQRGIALIEALVGMLIFTFGVLGLVGLQASMTQAQTASRLRAEAANLASELFGLAQTDHPLRLTEYTTDRCLGYSRCADWHRKVDDQLPGAKVELVPGVGGSLQLTLSWSQGGDVRNQYVSTMVWAP